MVTNPSPEPQEISSMTNLFATPLPFVVSPTTVWP